jgi:hypothetical protein
MIVNRRQGMGCSANAATRQEGIRRLVLDPYPAEFGFK